MELKKKELIFLKQMYINTVSEQEHIISIIERSESYLNNRSDRWLESKKGEHLVEVIETIEMAKDGITQAIENLEYLFDLLEIEIP